MINEWNELKRTFSSKNGLVSYAVVAALLAAYLTIYRLAPFGAPFDNLALNTITSIAALVVAGVSTAIFLHYHPEDHPRKIWKNMMFGAWLWFGGEAAWQVYAFLFEEVPVPSFADLSWVVGFAFYTIAIYYQYSAIKPTQVETIRVYALGIWIVALLAPLVLLSVADSFSLDAYIDFFYPFADLTIGAAGLMLVFYFRGGALMRPWIGLMIIGVSDLLYAWAANTQLYAWSVDNGNILSLFIDATYLLAYLILAIGFLGQWMLLTRGLQTK
jgi:multisubunit Na+/H+ antiporter MnhB subunit